MPPEAEEFPAAEAQFVIDGNVAAKRISSFSGQDAVLFFGDDPQVTADHRLVKKSNVQSDPDRKIEQCAFLTEVINAKSIPVKILIEEPLPGSIDEMIKYSYSFDPAPSEQDGAKAIWAFELPAGGKKAISTFLRSEAFINTK